MSYITNTPVFNLAKILIDPSIQSYHLFRKYRTARVYKLLELYRRRMNLLILILSILFRKEIKLIVDGTGSKPKTAQGNLLLRFMELGGKLHLRITTGNREFIYAKVLREPSNSKDKWLSFMAMLLESWQTQNYFAYTVELKLRD